MHQYITLSEITLCVCMCVYCTCSYSVLRSPIENSEVLQSTLESDSRSWMLSFTMVCFSFLWMFAFTSGANVKAVYHLLIITLQLNYSESIQCPH